MRRHLVALAIFGAFLGLWLSPGRACAANDDAMFGHQIEQADKPGRGRVSYVETWRVPNGRRPYLVELSNGAVYLLRACRFEDSRRCVWDATRRGNKRGRSFASLPGGRVVTIPARIMRRAR